MILVTGAAGLNGSAAVREFSRKGVQVRALVRDRSKASALAELPHVELVEGDMARGETLGAALKAIKRVLMISSANPRMVETQCWFVDACKSAGVAHVVKFSGRTRPCTSATFSRGDVPIPSTWPCAPASTDRSEAVWYIENFTLDDPALMTKIGSRISHQAASYSGKLS